MSETENHPFLNLALAMFKSDDGCRICSDNITHHEMLGDQVLAASKGGGLQMHRRCWEIMTPEERSVKRHEWLAEETK